MKIIISGGTGYLGTKIVEMLIKSDHEVLILTRKKTKINIKNQIKYETLFNNPKNIGKVDLIIHCANTYSKNNNSLEVLNSNLLLPLKLLDLAIHKKFKYFINIDTILNNSLDDYTESKLQLRYWLKKVTNPIIVNVRIDNFFGPGYNNSKGLIKIISLLKNNVNSIELTGGKQRRNYIYIDDVVDAINLIINNLHELKNFKEYQIAGSKSISLYEIIELVKKITNNKITKLEWGNLPYRQNEVFSTNPDLSLIKLLGWKQKFTIKEGLIKTINFE